MVLRIICRITLYLMVASFYLFSASISVAADSEIKITVADPANKGEERYDGTTVNSALFTTTVSAGEDKVLGTLRISGKKDVRAPLKPGDMIMVSLPTGLCYMQTPTVENYRDYVEWPQSLDDLKNQIRDNGSNPGVRFVSGTSRSITVEISNVDFSGQVTFLDFVFNKKSYSAVRVSRLHEVAREFMKDPDGHVTRREFLGMIADITMPFPSCPLKFLESDKQLGELFSDVLKIPSQEMERIKLLVDSGVVAGYQGLLRPDENITRAEAANLVGNIFPPTGKEPVFTDTVPGWAVGLANAAAYGIVVGYPDGTFKPDQAISKSEALAILQKTLESYPADH